MREIAATGGFPPPQSPGQAKPGSAQEQLLARIRRENPDRADALQRQLDDSQSVLAQMEAMKKSLQDAPKADAAQRIARIKEEIRMLQMMGGDPKTVARRVAQLARELGQAARTYAAAGGSGTQTGASAGGTENATAATGGTGANGAESQTAGEAKLGDYRQAQLDELRAGGEERAARAREADGDRNFRDEVRALAAKLRELARKAARELKEQGENDNPDLAAAKRGLDEAEKAAAQIGSQAAAIAAGASLSVFA